MKVFTYVGKKLGQLCSSSCFCLKLNKFSLELLYFLFISCLGFFTLQSLDPKTATFIPRNLDLFFTSVSAATNSSMSTVEMEVFSHTQLVILTLLMFIGGEVFISMVALHLRKHGNKNDKSSGFRNEIELDNMTICQSLKSNDLKYKSIKFLGLVVLVYLLFVQFLGVVSVLIYINVVSSAKKILNDKGLHALTFSIFTVVSTFSSCGFVPTNENMLPFKQNSGLLLILVPQILLGNTLYPSVLRFLIWAIGKFTKKPETSYLLKNSKILGYHHLLPHAHSCLLVITVTIFIAVQFILFSSMEWSSDYLEGVSVYEKIVGILFQTVNSRHAGESIVDLSAISHAVLVLFVVMMYLPPYTSFLPITQENCEQGSNRNEKFIDNLIFSQLAYLVIFIILVCITERRNIIQDPLNFNVLNIVVEVISAYGNVGFSMGYDCDPRLKHDGSCENKWYGFSGKWTDEGKIVLIVVMIFGRLKKFNMNGGKAWKLL